MFLDVYSSLKPISPITSTCAQGGHSFRTFAEKAHGLDGGGVIIYAVRRARSDVFYNLPRDAISISDRSISRDTCTHGKRESRLLIHGCTRRVRHMREYAHARTHAYIREKPQG